MPLPVWVMFLIALIVISNIGWAILWYLLGAAFFGFVGYMVRDFQLYYERKKEEIDQRNKHEEMRQTHEDYERARQQRMHMEEMLRRAQETLRRNQQSRPPPPRPKTPPSPWRTLGIKREGATVEIINRAFRMKAMKAHPDHKGGTEAKMLKLNLARDAALREIGAK